MKKYLFTSVFFFISFTSLILAQPGWTELNGTGISQPASQLPHNQGNTAGFRIGNSGYLGTGYFDHVFFAPTTNYFFRYDLSSNLWQPAAYLPGNTRSGAVAFEISGKGYTGLGADDTIVLADIWEFDSLSASWTQKADFPGTLRNGSAYFTNNGKGYIVGGDNYNGNFTYYNDCWEFDPVANAWNQKANFPLSSVTGGATFTINQYSYLTSFFNGTSTLSTTYRYDQPSDSWDTVATYPGTYARFGFSLLNSGYVVDYLSLYQYNPVTNTWISKADLPNNIYDRFAITDNSNAYVMNGNGDVLQYNPTSDEWTHIYKSPTSYQEPFGHAIIIGDTAYSGMWKYDFANDFWRVDSGLAGANWLFSIGNLGYVYIDSFPYGSFHEFNPVTRTWSRLPQVSLKTAQIYFSINGKGYFGMGQDSLSPNGNSFYEYDPAISTWTRKSDFPGTCRLWPASFSMLNKGYVAGGGTNFSDTLTEFWEYNPSIDTWLQKANTPGTCYNCLGIEYNGKGYYGFGSEHSDPGPDYSLFNFYDPSTNSWSSNLNRPVYGHGVIGFSKNGKMYLGRGAEYYSHPYSDQLYNFWFYDETAGIASNETEQVLLYPNPASSKLVISSSERISCLRIFNADGQEIFIETKQGTKSEIDIHSYPTGIYFLELTTVRGNSVKKFMKE